MQNASGASFSYVAVSLHRWVTIQYQNDVRLRLRDKVATARFPGVQSGEVVTSPGRLLPLQLPQDLQQSVSGMAVNYTYYIRVKLQVRNTTTQAPLIENPSCTCFCRYYVHAHGMRVCGGMTSVKACVDRLLWAVPIERVLLRLCSY